MRNTEEIKNQLEQEVNPDKKLNLILYLLANKIMRVNPEKYEAEHLEAIIFSSLHVFQEINKQDKNSCSKNMIFFNLVDHIENTEEVFQIFANEDSLIDIELVKIFFNERHLSIKLELYKNSKHQEYTTPFLLNNLYCNPTNFDNIKTYDDYGFARRCRKVSSTDILNNLKFNGFDIKELHSSFTRKYNDFIKSLDEYRHLIQ